MLRRARKDCPVGCIPARFDEEAAQTDIETALEFFAFAMAVDAVVLEQGADVPLKGERLPLLRGGSLREKRGPARRSRSTQDQKPQCLKETPWADRRG